MRDIEEIITELVELSKRSVLSREELEKAKNLMIRLRKCGFTNREISELTGNSWSEPTEKLPRLVLSLGKQTSRILRESYVAV